MKARRVLLALMAAFVFLAAGCAKVPQELMEESGNEETEQGKEGLTAFDTVDHILETIDTVKKEKFDNLIFPDDLTVNQPKEVGLLKFKQIDDFDDNEMEMLNAFIDKINPKIKLEKDMTGLQYLDHENKRSFAVDSCGFFFFAKEEGDSWINILNGELGDYTAADPVYLANSYEDESFQWEGKEVKLSQMIQKAQEYGDQLSQKYDNLEWIPNEVQVFQNKNGEYFFQFSFVKAYEGMHFFYSDYRQKIECVKEPYVLEKQSIMLINMSGEMLLVDNYPGVIEYEETEKEYDKIITLEYAANQLSQL